MSCGPCSEYAGHRPGNLRQNPPMRLSIVDPSTVRDLAPLLLDDAGRLKVVPSSVLAETSDIERTLFGVRHACYVLPTVELVEHIRALIAGRTALEIGSGNGVLAAALGIPATDNLLQLRPDVAQYYQALRQPVIRYGKHVQRLDAHAAIAQFKPQVVVAAWVTHRYDPNRHWAEGNEDGVHEESVLAQCEQYIFIGNDAVHAKKSIWSRPHDKTYPPFVFSRARDGSKNFIAVWQGQVARS